MENYLALVETWEKLADEKDEDIARLTKEKSKAVDTLRRLWEAVKAYDRIGFEGDHLLEVMSESREVFRKYS